jgi:hypothetical protein
MPDLLTHVLLVYVLMTLFSFRVDWLTPKYVTIAMLGALVPDLTKIRLILSGGEVGALIGLPFDWHAIHTLGGILVAITIGTLLTDRANRKYVFGLLLFGSLSHLFLDTLLLNASGYSYDVFWPFTAYRPSTPGFYLSSDRWPTVITGTLAIVVWCIRYRR